MAPDPARRAQKLIGPDQEDEQPLKAERFVPRSKIREPEDGHDHRLPITLQLLVILMGLGMLAGSLILSQYLHETNQRIAELEQYVEGRGQYRDRESAQQEEAFRRGMCDVLDLLPAGAPALEVVREKYHCGPGAPLTSFSAHTRAELEGDVPETIPPDDEPAPIQRPTP